MAIWKRLGIFWKQSNCTVRTKLTVYDSIIRSKLMYSLESAALTPADKKDLDTFQLKGLRQILKLKPTYSAFINEQGQTVPRIIRENTNANVYATANEKLNENNEGNKKQKTECIKKLSEYYEERKCMLIEKLIDSPQYDTVARTTFNPLTLVPHFHGRKRRGRPNKHWADESIKTYWSRIHHNLPLGTDESYDSKNAEHRIIIKESAKKRLFSSPP